MDVSPAPSTDDLLARAQAGDRAAWGGLAERYTHRVRLALLADGLGLDASRDLAQEAWTRLWARHQRGELPRLELPGLVVAQARFLAQDLRRRERAAPAPAQEPPEPVADAPPPDRQLAAAQALEQVQRVLATRPARQQRIFRLAVDEQRPHADIAAGEGLSLQRVRQIIYEVRCALRGALDHPEESP